MRLASVPKTLLAVGISLMACLFAGSSVSATDLRFISGSSALGIPFELHQNLIYLRVRVNGSEPLLFLFDTGARTILSRKSAQLLRLKLEEERQVYVTGEASPVNVTFAKNISYSLPNLLLTVSESGVVPLEDLKECTGRGVGGILGHELFSRSVVEIDYRARVINIYEPRHYNYAGRGHIIPLEMKENGLIFVRGVIKPSGRPSISGRFMIDTGFAYSVLLFSPFVEAHNLLAPSERNSPTPVCGIGGEARAITGTLENLQVSSLSFKNPRTIFTQANRGNFAATDLDGLIGGEIFREFKIIFDYQRRRMIWEAATAN